ncbi:MAG: ScpA family protein [Nanoarchaeota archaeon]
MQDMLYNMLVEKNEVTWQSLIYELVRTGQMDPWDIDIVLLSRRYLKALREMKEANFFISGKVILAAAILLKIKSNKLLTEHIAGFDAQLFSTGETEELSNFNEEMERIKLLENPRLTIKTPLARRKKVGLKDLMDALQKALEVDKKRTLRRLREIETTANLKIPEKKIDITELIKEVYSKIKLFFTKQKELTFTQLVSSDRREDKIYTFLPLLHLDSQQKIILSQSKHFGEIKILLQKI